MLWDNAANYSTTTAPPISLLSEPWEIVMKTLEYKKYSYPTCKI